MRFCSIQKVRTLAMFLSGTGVGLTFNGDTGLGPMAGGGKQEKARVSLLPSTAEHSQASPGCDRRTATG